MIKKFDVNQMDLLTGPDRADRVDIYRVLATIPILKHHRIADVGCGPGYFTVPLAKYVFDGKVIALDVQPEMVDACKERVEAAKLTNVEFAVSEEVKLPVESETIDGALMAFVFQEVSSRKRLLREVNRTLKKGGWLTIMEWHKVETDYGPPLKRRIPEDDMRKMTEDVGMRYTARLDLNSEHYMIVMRK